MGGCILARHSDGLPSPRDPADLGEWFAKRGTQDGKRSLLEAIKRHTRGCTVHKVFLSCFHFIANLSKTHEMDHTQLHP